ncbi:zinc-ribbon domain-containing protein [Cohnella cholangitidis]|uniref:Zinc-ribbon domain-containing protein n=2 Tax=Cohnella cholangitidis TaxID=2598458 RepID=A0A7G5C236_9BACL|nr:zinc-ribbon domain-containing protein [Cohnella cholangitidis]
MYCTQCGNKVEDHIKFCPQCGNSMDSSSAAPKPAAFSPPPYGEQQVTPKGQRNPKSGTVYVALGWVFFGLSFLFIPILFGGGSFIMGFMVHKVRNQTHGVILMVMAVVGALLGSLIGFIVGSMAYE